MQCCRGFRITLHAFRPDGFCAFVRGPNARASHNSRHADAHSLCSPLVASLPSAYCRTGSTSIARRAFFSSSTPALVYQPPNSSNTFRHDAIPATICSPPQRRAPQDPKRWTTFAPARSTTITQSITARRLRARLPIMWAAVITSDSPNLVAISCTRCVDGCGASSSASASSHFCRCGAPRTRLLIQCELIVGASGAFHKQLHCTILFDSALLCDPSSETQPVRASAITLAHSTVRARTGFHCGAFCKISKTSLRPANRCSKYP